MAQPPKGGWAVNNSLRELLTYYKNNIKIISMHPRIYTHTRNATQ